MIFGWDISTAVVGVTALDHDGKWVKTDHFDFHKMAKEAKSLHDKMDESEWWVKEFLSQYKTGSHTHFFEDRLANFSAGRTMLQTLMTLAGFNCLFSYEVWRIHKEVATHEDGCTGVGTIHIHPSTVKAIMKREGLVIPKGADKKKLTLEFVKNIVPGWQVFLNKNENPHPFNYDRADSYIVARAGYLRKYVLGDATRKEALPPAAGAQAAGQESRT